MLSKNTLVCNLDNCCIICQKVSAKKDPERWPSERPVIYPIRKPMTNRTQIFCFNTKSARQSR